MNSTDTRIFFDTNVLAYTLDSKDERKQTTARRILDESILAGTCRISTQVLQELFNVATKKLHYTKEEMKLVVEQLTKLPVHEAETSDVSEAVDISIRYGFTIFDSMIIQAAKRSSCGVIYSEDLSDGQVVEGVLVKNPFN